jgi:hypothetical protein
MEAGGSWSLALRVVRPQPLRRQPGRRARYIPAPLSCPAPLVATSAGSLWSGAVHPVVRTPAMSGAPGNGVRIRPPEEAPQHARGPAFAQEARGHEARGHEARGNDKPLRQPEPGRGCTRGGAGSRPVAPTRQGDAAPSYARGPGRARGRGQESFRAGSLRGPAGRMCGEMCWGMCEGGWRGRARAGSPRAGAGRGRHGTNGGGGRGRVRCGEGAGRK